MQSRISFFDKTVFRKNLTRFAPAWGLYTICMFMGLFLMIDERSTYWLGDSMAQSIQVMGVITPCYALLVAQLLFGDLYNARMCNALHALPLRRETWYFTNLASALVFHLIPTVSMGTAATVLMAVTGFEGAWATGLCWILGTNLQFLCFFGIAVFSVFCVGSRFAMAVVYGILNFGAIIAAWMVGELYVPMYYGIQMDYSPMSTFSPVYRMVEKPFIIVDRIYEAFYNKATEGELLLGECWWYYWAAAAVGCLLMGLAVQLYRKRRLECAGDFVAVKAMGPVFLVVYAVLVGAVFSFVVSMMFGYSNALVFLFVGLGVGYFTGRMLLSRKVQVFQLGEWVRCGALMGVMALSLAVAAMDPLGIVDWMPEAGDIQSVQIATGHYTYHECERTLTGPEDIEAVLQLHQNALARMNEDTEVEPTTVDLVVVDELQEATLESQEESRTTISITIRYTLSGGRTVSRYYDYWSDQPEWDVLLDYFSDPECLFGEDLTAQALAEQYPVVIFAPNIGENLTYSDPEDVLALYEAILLDCQEGTMAQSWSFHYKNDATIAGWLNIGKFELDIFSDAAHTLQWFQEHGYDWESICQQYYLG